MLRRHEKEQGSGRSGCGGQDKVEKIERVPEAERTHPPLKITLTRTSGVGQRHKSSCMLLFTPQNQMRQVIKLSCVIMIGHMNAEAQWRVL